MNITAFDIARRFLGVKERDGADDNPFIRWCHSTTFGGEMGDDVAWCSSFANGVAFILDLPRSRSKSARSWLQIGKPVELADARPGFDVVIFKRGNGPQPGADVLQAPGHVAWFGALYGPQIEVLGGNQHDSVSLERLSTVNVLGVRRLWTL